MSETATNIMEGMMTKFNEITRNAFGFAKPQVKEFVSEKPHRVADKDSLRFSQAWFDQWDDERSRNALVANIARDDAGYWRAIGFSHHPVQAGFRHLPGAINAVPPAQQNAFLNSPATMRTFKPRFNWDEFN